MPERFATWTKGRSFRLSACERLARAGQAPAKIPMTRAIWKTVTPCSNEVIRIRNSRDGTETKTSIRTRSTASTFPLK